MSIQNILKRTIGAFVAPAAVAVTLASAAIAADKPAPALWKLSDEDSQVYLFGTVHILDPELSWHSAKVDEAFRASDVLVLEADVPETPNAEMMGAMQKYGFNPAGVTLTSLIGEQTSLQIIQTLVSFGIPEAQAAAMKAQMEPFRPWLVGLQLAAIQQQSRGADPKAGVEAVLKKAAAAEGHSLAYFETLEQQFSFFADLSTDHQVEMLKEGMKQMVEQPDLLDNLVADWAAGNAEKVGIQMQEAINDPVLYQALLTNRNINWADQIQEIMAGSGNYFIAVGTGHLVGPHSVQVYLEQKGLNVERVQ